MITNSKHIEFAHSRFEDKFLFFYFTNFPLDLRGKNNIFKGTNGYVLSSERRPEFDFDERTVYGPGQDSAYDQDVCVYYNSGKESIDSIFAKVVKLIEEYNFSIV